MAEHPTEFTRLNTELATQATDVSLNWFRQMAEQNLKQSCGSLQELLNVTRRMIGELDNQGSALREHSMALAEETIANTPLEGNRKPHDGVVTPDAEEGRKKAVPDA